VIEIGFKALARQMAQRNDGLLFRATVLQKIALHLGVAPRVTVFVAEAPSPSAGHLSSSSP
jgi:hypothetical protein